MAYCIHISRDGGIPLEGWKAAVAQVDGLRLDGPLPVAIHPRTGARLFVPNRDGHVWLLIDDEWERVFGYSEGEISFKAAAIDLRDPDDPVHRVVAQLGRILSARVTGDGGEEYSL
jgi:hypothetical protein